MNLRTFKTKILHILNPALLLTFARPVLIAQTVIEIEAKEWLLALLANLLAAFTDIADGYVARALDCKTKLGAFLDPIFDKVMLLLLFYFAPVYATIVVALEIGGIGASATLRKYLNKHYTSPISKHITAGQMGLVSLLILLAEFSVSSGWPIHLIGVSFILLSYTRVSIYIQGLQEKEYLKTNL